MSGLRAAAADLLWGSRCVACGFPGRPMCRACRAELLAGGVEVSSDVAGVAGAASCSYQGVAAAAIPAMKDRGIRGLAAPLGAALAAAVGLLTSPGAGRVGRLWLVPVPAAPQRRRSGSADHTLALARQAAHRLRAAGIDVAIARDVLGYTRAVADQAGLGRAERELNRAGAFTARPGPLLRAVRAAGRSDRVLVVDDVVTTGATLRACVHALDLAGVRVDGIATVAATPAPGSARDFGQSAPMHGSTPGTSVGPWHPSGSVVAPEPRVEADRHPRSGVDARPG